jgi:branched-subunit amino acid aminotransferase/4-amino-4-deoxychorismate lyase
VSLARNHPPSADDFLWYNFHMETFMKADIFFFVTTVAVGLITIGILFVLFHLARFMSTCNRIAKKLELKAEEISNEAEELVKDVRESFLFRLLFPRTKKARTRRK